MVTHFNDVDTNLYTSILSVLGEQKYLIKITNNKFIDNKLFTIGLGDSLPIDNNTIEVISSLSTNFTYFKIEVYN